MDKMCRFLTRFTAVPCAWVATSPGQMQNNILNLWILSEETWKTNGFCLASLSKHTAPHVCAVGEPHQNWIRKCNQGGLIMDGGLFSSASSSAGPCLGTASRTVEGEGKLSTVRRIKRTLSVSGTGRTYWCDNSTGPCSPVPISWDRRPSLWHLWLHLSHMFRHIHLRILRETEEKSRVWCSDDYLASCENETTVHSQYSHTKALIYLNCRKT